MHAKPFLLLYKFFMNQMFKIYDIKKKVISCHWHVTKNKTADWLS